MERVIEADADDLAGIEWGQQRHIRQVSNLIAFGELSEEVAARGKYGLIFNDAVSGTGFG